jgi:Tfp pilus assembly protein PilF
MRARILQAQHDFAGAATELNAALRDAPDSPQALILLASIDEAVGDFGGAKEACSRFGRLRPGLTATACAASVGSQTGDSQASYAALSDAVAQAPSADRNQLLWAFTILGEIAMRRDDPAAADYLKQALAIDPHNVYALTVYADFLLDHGGAVEVIRMLTGLERLDSLYLRLALAALAAGDASFPRYRNDLAARFAAGQRQGDTMHLRDASRYALEIERDGPRALELARENWIKHKTPYDARALLVAAIACNDADAAKPVSEWVRANRLEDRTIARLLNRIWSG